MAMKPYVSDQWERPVVFDEHKPLNFDLFHNDIVNVDSREVFDDPTKEDENNEAVI